MSRLDKRFYRLLAAFGLFASLCATVFAGPTDWQQAAAGLREARLSAATADAILARARERGVEPARIVAWAEKIRRAQKAGLPAAPMGERIAEGLMKGIPAARIDQALEMLRDNLVWSKRVVDERVPRAEVRARPADVEQALRGMDAALRAGVTRQQLERIVGTSPLTTVQLSALVRVVGNLRSFGVEAESIVRLLGQAGEAGLGAGELDMLEREFTVGAAAGRPLTSLVAEFERGMAQIILRNAREHSDDRGRYSDDRGRDMRDEIRQWDAVPDYRDAQPPIPPAETMNPGGYGGY